MVTPTSFTLTGPGPGFGENLGIADLNLDGALDLLVITGDKFSGNTAQALIYPSSVASSQTFTNQLLPDGLSYSWAAPNIDVGTFLEQGPSLLGCPMQITARASTMSGRFICSPAHSRLRKVPTTFSSR